MLGTSTPFAITATLNKSLPCDPGKDFAPIALTSNAPFLLLVNPEQPVRSVAELVALAKSKPGQLSYGSAGPGSPQHLSFELLKTMTGARRRARFRASIRRAHRNRVAALAARSARQRGIDVVHVPHRGDAPALTNLVAGHIPMMFGEPTPVLPLLKDGRVRALAVSSATRLPIAPEIPTVAEAGVPGFNLTSWQMIVAPAGTPKEIIDRLHVEVKHVLDLPEIKADFARTGRITVDYLSVDELHRFMRSEIVRLGKVVEQAGIARSQ
jgi:tripartite-type tricarboxylate transporter receptor subunit TctC